MPFLVDREILQAVRHLAAHDGVLLAAVFDIHKVAGVEKALTK